MSTFSRYLTKEQINQTEAAIEQLLKGLGTPPDMVKIFHTMTRDQKVFVAMLIRQTTDLAIESVLQVMNSTKKS